MRFAVEPSSLSLCVGPIQSKDRQTRYFVGGFFIFPLGATVVVTVGRTASAETGLGGAVSFLGFFTIF